MASTTTAQPNAEQTTTDKKPLVEQYAHLLETVGKNSRVKTVGDDNYFMTGDEAQPTASLSVVVGKGNLAQAMEQVDKSGPENYRKLAMGIGLPVEPFSPKLIRTVIMGEFQIAWHRADGQTEEALQQIVGKQVARVKHYLVELEDLKNKPQPAPKVQGIKDMVRSSGGGGGTRGTRANAGATYKLDETRKEIWSKFDKQKGIIIKAFETAGGSASAAKLKEIIDMLPDGQKMTTNQPVERVIAFYLAEWKRNGLVLTTDAPPAPQPTPDQQQQPVKEAEQAKEPPAQEPEKEKKPTKEKEGNGKKKKNK